VGAVLTSLVLALAVTDLLEQLELDTVDARFELRGDQPPPSGIVQVDIDDRTFQALQETWPLPRRMHGRVIDALNRAGAKAIAYDVQFTEPTVRRQDEALMTAVGRAGGRVVLGTTEVNERGEPGIFGSLEQLRALGGRAGSMLLVTDRDGIVRRLPYAIDGLKSLAVATAEVAERRRISPEELGGTTAWIDFRGQPQTIRHVSFSDVLRSKVDEAVFRDKVVLVGGTAPTLQDYESTSIGADKPMAGVEVHANALWTVLQRTPLEPAGNGLRLALIVLLGMLVPLAAAGRRGRRGARAFFVALALAIGIGGLYLVATRLAFSAGLILPVVYPLTALVLSTVGVAQTELTMAVLERDRIRARFSRYVPESIVDEVISKTDDDLCLGGERVMSTVVMCDLRDFTTFAEDLPPQRALDTLNVYLSEMSEAIRSHGGTLIDYQSDGIVAAFGAPIEQEDHADQALKAVREMVGPRLETFNAWVRESGLGPGFRIGIGVDSGIVMSGNMGCSFRLEYTVIGDTANTASRLEEMTKQYPHQVLITETTVDKRIRDKSELPCIGTTEIRGRKGMVKLYTLDEADVRATVTQMPVAERASQRSPGTTSPVS
jgi:adenylate cyclase